MLTIDGSFGEGGGQILRTSLALSAITGTPVRIEQIRAKRPKPGLQRQHLVAVQAAARVCNGQLEGAALGSREITLHPQQPVAGDYRFAIGSAGSASLVLQTVLPVLLRADGPSRVEISGGTHNPLAPPFEFLRDAFLPRLAEIGAQVELRLVRHGFYPAGGGTIIAQIQPLAQAKSLDLRERGRFVSRRAEAWVANLPIAIAEREMRTVQSKLRWSADDCHARVVESCDGPGNVVIVTVAHQRVTEVTSAFGAVRVPAEDVARRAAQEMRRWLEAEAPVGEHLADQLLLPLAIAAGGAFRTVRPSEHLTTNAAVIARFLGERVTLRELCPDDWLVGVAPDPG
ncbi:MAG: RNA 3'-terminal phosphate cyclase [Planctomycetes bacterium]|nr:RNA 3'-terminal phosphate cyclase [Planctomycetota bacterium]